MESRTTSTKARFISAVHALLCCGGGRSDPRNEESRRMSAVVGEETPTERAGDEKGAVLPGTADGAYRV